ncbi:MAG TPA: Gfo/Idh/MocA family oxidoreductase [Bacteroidota bacterium]|nr:Gfo/Idh/MocA family oxidoreductase [Bacteroidota bacterium]
MKRIGLVDLDTSHPRAFAAILKTIPGVEVAALWDGHDVWPPGYDGKFAAENGIRRVCARLEEMPAQVDAAMILGTNWDAHIDRALVFMKEKIPVLIDKPVVGSVRDCERLLDLREKYGARVFGGSSLRYAREVTALRSAIATREEIASVAAAGPGDFFSYGIHTTEMLQGFAGSGIRSVRAVMRHGIPVVTVTYGDGLVALLHLQMSAYEWSLGVCTTGGMRTATVAVAGLYEPFLKAFAAWLECEETDFDVTAPLEAVRVHLAAEISLRKGTEIALASIPADAGFDGRAFASAYAADKLRQAPAAAHT